MFKPGKQNYGYKHGKVFTPAWRSWNSMMSRVKSRSKRYRERGIKVCKRWHIFENFFKDMGERPGGHTLDRIDNAKDYSPSNCRWATPKQQARNRGTNRLITHNGLTKTAIEWSEDLGVGLDSIYYRHKRGYPIDKQRKAKDGEPRIRKETLYHR